jgi:hypothetical protein
MTQPLDYATPSKPRRWWLAIVVAVAAFLAVLMFFGLMRKPTKGVAVIMAVPAVPPGSSMVLPSDPYRFKLANNQAFRLPGTGYTSTLFYAEQAVGDPMITVVENNGGTPLNQRMRPGDVRLFSDFGVPTYIRMLKVDPGEGGGPSIATFELATTPFSPTTAPQ